MPLYQGQFKKNENGAYLIAQVQPTNSTNVDLNG